MQTLLAALLVIVGVGLVFAVTVLTGMVVGAIPPAVREGLDSPAGRRLAILLAAVAGMTLLSSGLGFLRTFVLEATNQRFRLALNRRLMKASLSPPGISHMEDRVFLDELALSQGVPGSRPDLLAGSAAGLVTMRLQALGSLLLLARFAWWAPLLLLAGIYLQLSGVILNQPSNS